LVDHYSIDCERLKMAARFDYYKAGTLPDDREIRVSFDEEDLSLNSFGSSPALPGKCLAPTTGDAATIDDNDDDDQDTVSLASFASLATWDTMVGRAFHLFAQDEPPVCNIVVTTPQPPPPPQEQEEKIEVAFYDPTQSLIFSTTPVDTDPTTVIIVKRDKGGRNRIKNFFRLPAIAKRNNKKLGTNRTDKRAEDRTDKRAEDIDIGLVIANAKAEYYGDKKSQIKARQFPRISANINKLKSQKMNDTTENRTEQLHELPLDTVKLEGAEVEADRNQRPPSFSRGQTALTTNKKNHLGEVIVDYAKTRSVVAIAETREEDDSTEQQDDIDMSNGSVSPPTPSKIPVIQKLSAPVLHDNVEQAWDYNDSTKQQDDNDKNKRSVSPSTPSEIPVIQELSAPVLDANVETGEKAISTEQQDENDRIKQITLPPSDTSKELPALALADKAETWEESDTDHSEPPKLETITPVDVDDGKQSKRSFSQLLRNKTTSGRKSQDESVSIETRRAPTFLHRIKTSGSKKPIVAMGNRQESDLPEADKPTQAQLSIGSYQEAKRKQSSARSSPVRYIPEEEETFQEGERCVTTITIHRIPTDIYTNMGT
jgi:hypothetical protein